MANYDDMSLRERRDIDDRIELGHGELVTIKYPVMRDEEFEVEEKIEVPNPDGGEPKYETVKRIEKRRVKVEVTERHYVGKMGAGETGAILGILGAVFVNGSTAKQDAARKDNMVFLEFLDEYHINLLLSLILKVEQDWVRKHFDLDGWVIDVVTAFFRYNNFFKLLTRVMETATKMGLTEQAVQNIALGESQNSQNLEPSDSTSETASTLFVLPTQA